MAFDPNWPHGHVTRDGRKARVICTDSGISLEGAPFPVAAIVQGHAHSIPVFTADGRYHVLGESPTDLQNAPAPKRKVRVKGWVNVYLGDHSILHHSRAAADTCASDDHRIACIEIDREVEEGEGL